MKKICFLLTLLAGVFACQSKVTESTTTNTTTDSGDKTTNIVQSPSDTTNMQHEKTTPSANDVEATIAQIKARYQQYMALENKGKLQKRTLTYVCDIFEGTVQYVFDEKDELLWIAHTWGGEHFHQTHQYFLEKGKLFFCFVEEGSWSFDPTNYDQKTGDSHTIDSFIEKRYYFDANKNLIRCLKKEYQVFSAKQNNPKSENIPNQSMDCPDTKIFFERLNKLQKVLPSQKQSRTDCIEGIER